MEPTYRRPEEHHHPKAGHTAFGHRPIRPELQRRPLMGEHHPGGKRQISVHHTKGTCPTGKKPPSGILQHVLHRQGHERQHLFLRIPSFADSESNEIVEKT